MSGAVEISHVSDDEIIFRRIPVSQGWVKLDPITVSPEAFRPRVDDSDGLSVTRCDFHCSAETAARGASKQGYWVAVLSARAIRAKGIEIAASPIIPGDPGHAHFPGLNYQNRDTGECLGWQVALARELVLGIAGPFVIRDQSAQAATG